MLKIAYIILKIFVYGNIILIYFKDMFKIAFAPGLTREYSFVCLRPEGIQKPDLGIRNYLHCRPGPALPAPPPWPGNPEWERGKI